LVSIEHFTPKQWISPFSQVHMEHSPGQITSWASLCLLVGAFNPFMFKFIIDKYDPITIYFIVLGLFLEGFSAFPV